MGIFDIFSTSDQDQAAADEAYYLNQGYGQLSDLFNQGRSTYTGYGDAATNDLQNLYGSGQTALGDYYGQGINTLQNEQAQTQAGYNQYANLLGVGGQGSAGMQSTLENMPGYQFTLNQGAQNVMRNEAATGQLASGATLNALQQQGQGTAQQNYQSYVSDLAPYLSANQNAAGATATGEMGLGGALNTNLTNEGNQLNENQLTQGGSLLNSYMTQGNAAYSTQASIGNAEAQAALAGLTQSGNIMGALGGLFSGGMGIFSDENMKEDIEPIGRTFDGQTIHRFRYAADPAGTQHVGLIAQDVERRNPDAVNTVPGTPFKAVDYRGATDYAAALGRRREAPSRGRAPRGADYHALLHREAA